MSINEVFAGTTQHYLPRDRDLGVFLETDRALLLVAIVEDDGHARLRHARLPALVYQILKILSADSAHVRDAENETYWVENVGLSATVQACDGVEAFVPADY